jgi:hypothetical protein
VNIGEGKRKNQIPYIFKKRPITILIYLLWKIRINLTPKIKKKGQNRTGLETHPLRLRILVIIRVGRSGQEFIWISGLGHGVTSATVLPPSRSPARASIRPKGSKVSMKNKGALLLEAICL